MNSGTGGTRPSPWTALLESLHSALIDELIERHPEPKPELGLPVRQNRFAVPGERVELLLLAEIALESSQGIALLASDSDFTRGIGIKQKELWQALLKRAAPDFARRGVQPKISAEKEFRSTDAFPPSTVRCARVIWIPIRIPAGGCFLGVGV